MQFDFIASNYDVLSKLIFSNQLEEAKTSCFYSIPAGANVLFIGGGSGKSLSILLKNNKNLYVDFVEASSKMIKLAETRVGNQANVKFINLTIEKFEGGNYDFIITEFFFDLFRNDKINSLMSHILTKLNPKGIWIDTDFRLTNKCSHAVLVKIMYFFFKITANIQASRLVDLLPLITVRGMGIRDEKIIRNGLITSRIISRSL